MFAQRASNGLPRFLFRLAGNGAGVHDDEIGTRAFAEQAASGGFGRVAPLAMTATPRLHAELFEGNGQIVRFDPIHLAPEVDNRVPH
ncbi:hypothetical protein CE91St30_17600 [Raoultibacter timonensis]|uniref:Uncharacterized protein n=1 Tax=Raoultibacter timonensis TaxID=1907662 RepID=A0ABN6MEL2_9ACTN|nr:hypothetical protein CE91St30_17600 [Raoultibacter timonensis]